MVIHKFVALSLGVLTFVVTLPTWASSRVFLDKREALFRDLADEKFLPAGMLSKFRSVEVLEADRFQKPLGATRLTAFADPRNKRIYVNENASLQGDLSTLILHESLLAAGYQDTNYEYSMMISLLLNDSKSRFLDSEVRNRYINSLRSIPSLQMVKYRLKNGSLIDRANGTLVAYGEGGGVVLVGGGGDLKSAQIKEQVMKKISVKLGEKNPAFFQRNFSTFVTGMKVEPWKDPTNTKRVRMSMIYNPQRNLYERIFYVPASVDTIQATNLIYNAMVFIGPLFDNGQELDYFLPRPHERRLWQEDRNFFRVKKHQK